MRPRDDLGRNLRVPVGPGKQRDRVAGVVGLERAVEPHAGRRRQKGRIENGRIGRAHELDRARIARLAALPEGQEHAAERDRVAVLPQLGLAVQLLDWHARVAIETSDKFEVAVDLGQRLVAGLPMQVIDVLSNHKF